MNNYQNPTAGEFRSGFAGLIGKPNVGKSTLMNTIVGHKVSIVTPKPQTTRNRILGILNHPDAQIIFIDVPGIHKPREHLHKIMVKTALMSLDEADCILYLVTPFPPDNSENFIISSLRQIAKPVILLINKIDLVPKDNILGIIDTYRKLFNFADIVPISALHNINMDKLVSLILPKLLTGPQFFPEHQITDLTESFYISENIREKVYFQTHKEIPYSVGVVIDEIEKKNRNRLISIMATIMVEKNSHKGIIIGKNGSKLKTIGKLSRIEIEEFLQTRIYLDLHVKHVPKWKLNPFFLKKMGL